MNSAELDLTNKLIPLHLDPNYIQISADHPGLRETNEVVENLLLEETTDHSKYVRENSKTAEIEIKLPKAVPLMGFGMRCANDWEDRNPSKFNVYYKNSEDEWEKVLSVEAEDKEVNPFDGPWDILRYALPSTIHAQEIKVEILDTCGSNDLQLGQILLYV